MAILGRGIPGTEVGAEAPRSRCVPVERHGGPPAGGEPAGGGRRPQDGRQPQGRRPAGGGWLRRGFAPKLALLAIVAPFVLLIAPDPARAEPLSLEAAVSLAMKNNPMLLESRENRRAAEAAHLEAKGSRFPSIEVREVGLRTDSPADVFGLEMMQERFSFPSFVQSDPNQPDPFDNFATEFTASMPLFTGGRIGSGIGQADAMAKASRAVEGYTRNGVAFAVVGAYMDALLADSATALATKARDTTARHVEQAEAFYEAGMIVESDLLLAKAQLARMEEGRIRAENGARLARAGLNRVLGVDQGRSFELDPDLPEPASDSLDLTEAIERAKARRGDLRAAGEKVRAASLGVSRARGELLPEIGLMARYNLNDDRMFGAHGKSYSLMAMARWNLFDGGRSWSRLNRSKHEAAAAREALRSYQSQVEFEARAAYQTVQEARARRAVTAGAAAAATKALAILEDRFDQGVARITDLLDAETVLNEARLRDLQARFDLGRAVRALENTTGSSPVPEVAE